MMNIERPLVSIALCRYNGEEFLAQQLDSLINQTYPNLEIIAVDDCSTDSTLQILHSFAEKYNNLQVFQNSERLGLSLNFEKAITSCNGKYIAVSDQDDIWIPEKIETLVPHIKDNILVYTRSELIDETGAFLNKISMNGVKKPYSGSDPRVITIINFTWGHNIMFDRRLIEYAFPLPENIDYDWYLGFTALNYGNILFVDKILVLHRQHSNSATSSVNRKKRKELENLGIYLQNALQLKDLRYKEFFQEMYCLTEKALAGRTGRIKLFFFMVWNMKILFSNSGRSSFSNINKIRKIIRKSLAVILCSLLIENHPINFVMEIVQTHFI